MMNTKPNLKKIALLFAIIGCNYFAQATKIVVSTSNFQFAPANITIQLGDTVMWQWVSGSNNTTSSVIPGGAIPWAASINSGATTFTYVPSVILCNIVWWPVHGPQLISPLIHLQEQLQV